MAEYTHNRIRELEKQLLLSPPQVRRQYADQLEKLVTSLDPRKDYSYEFIYFRATGFRPTHALLESYRGSKLREDLLRLLGRVSQSAPTDAAEVPEPVLSIEEISAIYNTASRTVYRWRSKGLISRTYIFPDGRRRTGIRKSALDHFVEANPQLLERASRFSRLSGHEREDILQQARALVVRSGLSRTAAAARIARRTGRAKETIRRTLSAAEHKHPHDPFPGSSRGRLPTDQKRSIYRAYQSGQSVGTLCERFRRSRSSIHRIINEARGRALLANPSVPGRFIADEKFTIEGAEEAILFGGAEQTDAAASFAGAVERYAGHLPESGPLDAEQERNLFCRYNYLKHKATRLKAEINPKRYVRAHLLNEIDALVAATKTIKQHLVETNLPLVEDVARKHTGRLVALDDLLNEGILTLKAAIDRFDYRSRGRFRSYARWALMRSFARTVPKEHY